MPVASLRARSWRSLRVRFGSASRRAARARRDSFWTGEMLEDCRARSRREVRPRAASSERTRSLEKGSAGEGGEDVWGKGGGGGGGGGGWGRMWGRRGGGGGAGW